MHNILTELGDVFAETLHEHACYVYLSFAESDADCAPLAQFGPRTWMVRPRTSLMPPPHRRLDREDLVGSWQAFTSVLREFRGLAVPDYHLPGWRRIRANLQAGDVPCQRCGQRIPRIHVARFAYAETIEFGPLPGDGPRVLIQAVKACEACDRSVWRMP